MKRKTSLHVRVCRPKSWTAEAKPGGETTAVSRRSFNLLHTKIGLYHGLVRRLRGKGQSVGEVMASRIMVSSHNSLRPTRVI
jgi:hypothetical protein